MATVKLTKSKKPDRRGGARPGSGRKKIVIDGERVNVWVAAKTTKIIRRYFPGKSISSFYRDAGAKALKEAERSQAKLEL